MLDPAYLATLSRDDLNDALVEAETFIASVRRGLNSLDAALGMLPPVMRQPSAPTKDASGNTTTKAPRPLLRDAIAIVIREQGNRPIGVGSIARALAARGWIGLNKEGKPSVATVRQTLNEMTKKGKVIADSETNEEWAPKSYRLPLPSPVPDDADPAAPQDAFMTPAVASLPQYSPDPPDAHTVLGRQRG
jgi:hypothetical protein